jgi:hypothetical protein
MLYLPKFIFILIVLVLLTMACDVQVTILLPQKLLPYYEWLTSFPTCEFEPPQPAVPIPYGGTGLSICNEGLFACDNIITPW